jgi:predicted nucleic acid-binding protein
MILLDTSVLVEALGAGGRLREAFRDVIARGERMAIPSLALYEWLRGPRLEEELRAREILFPDEGILPFGPQEARSASELYGAVRNPRGREVDLAIAAAALTRGACLWTLNGKDFEDVPGLRLWDDGDPTSDPETTSGDQS